MESTIQNRGSGRLVKATHWVLLTEIILFAIGVCFPGMHPFFLVWLLVVVILNAVFIIACIIEKPQRFLLYVAVLLAIPLVPAALLLVNMGRMGC